MPEQATPDIHKVEDRKQITIPYRRNTAEEFVDVYRQYKSNETFIFTLDHATSSGAHHWYEICGDETHRDSRTFFESCIFFQKEPIKEVGSNGCQIEDMLLVAMHRLVCLQQGPFPCEENEAALLNLKEALFQLDRRTKNRQKRGVEGENKA